MPPFVYSIRYNKYKSNPDIEDAVMWEKNATYIAKKDFYLEPEWHAGNYYVQESSSMFLGYILQQININKKDIVVLDLCAAPGGKSTHILDKISENSLLISNELIPKRNAILKENLIRWGNPNIIITQNEAKHFKQLGNFFDLIVIDAPCSGEGLFKKNPEAIQEWSEENVQICAVRQREILNNIIPCVKENGYIIYSTCTFQECENEAQIEYLLNHGFELVDIDATNFNEISNGKIKNTFRFELEKVKGSGFFIACLKKKEANIENQISNSFSFYNKIEKTNFKEKNHWIKQHETYNCFNFKENIYAFHKNFIPILKTIQSNLYITYFGVEIGFFKKDIFIPAHALALSTIINQDINHVEVDKKKAINYLKKIDISIENYPDLNNKKSTWSVIQYNKYNLGWIKILQNRINNYLPNHWRILKQ